MAIGCGIATYFKAQGRFFLVMTTFPPQPGRRSAASLWYDFSAVAAASIAMAATLPGRTHGLGLITKRLLEDFSAVSPRDFAQINLVATLIGALFCLPCGWLIDRYGAGRLATLVTAALAGIVWWMCRIEDANEMGIAITLSRGVGQSMLSVASLAIVGKAFPRRPGIAMGAYAVLMTVLMATATGLLGARVIAVGWRDAWRELGLALFISVPILWLLSLALKRSSQSVASDTADSLSHASLRQALSTSCFWIFALSVSFFGFISSGISLYQQFILEERGLDERTFHTVLIVGMVAGLVANLGGGWLSTRYSLQYLLAAGMLLLAGSLAWLSSVSSPTEVYLYAVVHGLAGGLITVLFFTVWGYAFGTRQLGRIQGAAQMLTVLASAVGPVVVSEARFWLDSYESILWVFALVSAGLGLAALATPVPRAAAGVWAMEPEIS